MKRIRQEKKSWNSRTHRNKLVRKNAKQDIAKFNKETKVSEF